MNPAKSTRERLLDEASVLVWRQGYNAVSVDEICKAARTNKGSFYYAFATKADLLDAVIERLWLSQRQQLAAIHAGSGSAVEKLRRHFEWYIDTQRRLAADHGFVPGQFHMAIDVHVPENARNLMRLYRDQNMEMLVAAIEAALVEMGGPADAAPSVATLAGYIIVGIMIEARLENSLEPVMELPKVILSLLDQVVAAASSGRQSA